MPTTLARTTRSRLIASALTLLAIAVVAGSFFLAYREVDRVTQERQVQTLSLAIAQHGRGLERELMVQTVWGDAFTNTAVSPNPEWMTDYYGSYLSNLLGYNEIYVLDSQDQPIYAFEEGDTRDGTAFETHRSDLADLIAAIRQGNAPGVTATTMEHGGDVAFEHRSISDVRLVEGQAVNVVIQTIVPDADLGLADATVKLPPLLIASYRLDEAFLERFGGDFNYDSLHWVELGRETAAGAAMVGSDEISTLVLSSNGAPVGTAAWQRNLPGQTLLGRMSLGLGLAALILVAIGMMALRLVRARTAELIQNERREATLARTDHLTGLANRLALNEEVVARLAALPPGTSLGVVTLDLDGFKLVNDLLGQLAGDATLKVVADRLRAAAGRGFVARLGGDEFVLLIPGASADQVIALAEAAFGTLKVPVILEHGERVPLNGSAGLAIAPGHGTGEADLFFRSDIALRRAKKNGRGRLQVFDAALEAKVVRRRGVETALRRALDAGAIDVFYQPLMSAEGDRVLGVEALARWTDPDLGPVSPGEFIVIAEETGMIVQLGEHVMRRALTDGAQWPDLTISVNVSALQIQHGDVAAMVKRLLEQCNFPAQRLEIELTESTIVADEGRASGQIVNLQKMGIRVALDDFGTGYASLLYLRQFGFDKLKIDQHFVRDTDTSVEARAMVISITTMCKTLGLEVTAEGIENAEQHKFLRVAGCDRMQGYLFSRPISAAALTIFAEKLRLAA